MGAMKKQTVRYHLTGYRLACVLCVSAAWLVFASSAFADGIIRDSVEAISGGRGGTNIANSDNGASLYAPEDPAVTRALGFRFKPYSRNGIPLQMEAPLRLSSKSFLR